MNIKNTKDLRDALRNGKYAWPGGYPCYFIADDGQALSYEAVLENYRLVSSAVKHKDTTGWRVIAVDINYENKDLYCAHTGERIECAYEDY